MRSLRLSFVLLLLGGCDPKEDLPHCPSRPAFRVLISTEEGGKLPEDTEVSIRYGGNGEETFALKNPPPSPQVLFCSPSEEGKALACELWTDGAANVKITGSNLETYDEKLAAVADDCGILTTLMEIKLKPGKNTATGGPP
jgi:hypothetical protein